jgi:prepilin peptidase CpaA
MGNLFIAFGTPLYRGHLIVLLALVLCAAIYDARYRRIPNWLTGSGVLVGIALNTFLYPGLSGLWFSLRGLGLGFGLYLLMHLLRAMGAGDVKMMAAVGSIVGAGNWFLIFLITAMLGGILALIVSIVKGRLRKTLFNVGFIVSEMQHLRPAYLKNEELDVRSDKGVRMPHGVVIAMGTLIFLAQISRIQ